MILIEERKLNVSPYKLFWNWMFDGDRKSAIPKGENVPDLLKYNSPINEVFLLRSFIRVADLNWFLNKWFNNLGIRYLSKEDLFDFFKQCIFDFKVARRNITYFPYQKKELIVERLRKKFPLLKEYDLELLSIKIQKSKEKDAILTSLGIEQIKKEKPKKTQKNITWKDFIRENFSVMEVK